MRTLPDFTSNPKCCKCGHTGISCDYVWDIDPQTLERFEFMVRECAACGYRWNENVLDKAENKQ